MREGVKAAMCYSAIADHRNTQRNTGAAIVHFVAKTKETKPHTGQNIYRKRVYQAEREAPTRCSSPCPVVQQIMLSPRQCYCTPTPSLASTTEKPKAKPLFARHNQPVSKGMSRGKRASAHMDTKPSAMQRCVVGASTQQVRKRRA